MTTYICTVRRQHAQFLFFSFFFFFGNIALGSGVFDVLHIISTFTPAFQGSIPSVSGESPRDGLWAFVFSIQFDGDFGSLASLEWRLIRRCVSIRQEGLDGGYTRDDERG